MAELATSDETNCDASSAPSLSSASKRKYEWWRDVHYHRAARRQHFEEHVETSPVLLDDCDDVYDRRTSQRVRYTRPPNAQPVRDRLIRELYAREHVAFEAAQRRYAKRETEGHIMMNTNWR